MTPPHAPAWPNRHSRSWPIPRPRRRDPATDATERLAATEPTAVLKSWRARDGDTGNVDPIGTADRLLGRAIERSMVAHHRHRLRRLGRLDALDPPQDASSWSRGSPPPRDGCSIDVLIDGAEVLPAIAEAIRGARRSLRIAGWHVAPHFALERAERPTPLRELLAQAEARGVDVRVLLWAGAPLHVFTPARSDVRADCRELARDTGVRVAIDDHERLLHCHHEKLVVVDDEIAFVGGVDLTDLGGDRWDTPGHPARGRLGWHTPAHGCAARSSPTWPSTSTSAGPR